MGVCEIYRQQNQIRTVSMQTQEKVGNNRVIASFSTVLAEQQPKCPYGGLANNGVVTYNGVVFDCDYKTNSLCLGDMSKPKEVLNISLPSGGHLKLNVNNFEDIAKAAGMFTPEDLNAIMRAIAQYNHYTKKVKELEDEEIETVENVTEKTDEKDFSEAVMEYKEAHQLSANQLKEEKDWRDMSGEEWDKMMSEVDKYLDTFKEHLRQMKEIQDEAAQKAALEADPGMKTIAASSAALAAADGFDTGAVSETKDSKEEPLPDEIKRKKNWTKNLTTDDQTTLMVADEAQKMERNARTRLQEIQLNGFTNAGAYSLNSIIQGVILKKEEAI